jgi:hypothetical protein
MTVQAAVEVAIAYFAEGSFGTAAATGASAKTIRRVNSNLNPQIDQFASNEVRQDQQIYDLRHGTRRGSGGIDGELSTVSYDDFIEASMRGTWAAGVNVCNPTNNTSVAWSNTGVATFGAGSLLTQNHKVGDVVRFTGLTGANAGLNGVNLRIGALTALTATLLGPPGTVFQTQTAQTTGWTMGVTGSKLLVGTTKRSFTIEQNYPGIDISELYTGARIGGVSIGASPNGMVSFGCDVLAQKPTVLPAANAPYFTTPNAQATTNILSGVTGAMHLNGRDESVLTGFSVNISNNLSAPAVLGNNYVPDIFYGRTVITGQISAFLEDETLIAAYLNEGIVDVTGLLTSADQLDFMSFSMQRVKLGGASKSVGPDGGVIAQFPYQALLQPITTGYDSSTLAIQRSN